MFRVKRFEAAIDITAAGTSAPIAIAANANPTNHGGNTAAIRRGTTRLGVETVMPAAIAMYPRSASRPSTSEYDGSSAAFCRTTLPLYAARTPVIACGYMKSASADPSASDAYGRYAPGGRIR